MLLDTVSKYPNSVAVTSLTVISPVPLDTRARLAVTSASLDNAISAVPLICVFVIDKSNFDCAIAAVPLMSALTRVVASSRNLIQLPP